MSAAQFKRIALTLASLCSCLAAFGQASKQPSFYQSIQHAIIQLQHTEPVYDPVKHVSRSNIKNGTAFFVEKEGSFYVITAAHVAREPFAFTAKIPLSLSDGTSAEAHLTLPADKWIFHFSRGDQTHSPVDVAAMKIVNHNGIKWFYYCSKGDCPKDTIIVSKEDMEPPTPVMVFGFPLKVQDLNLLRPVPLGRQGIIALVDKSEDEIRVEGNLFFDRLGFVIDIPTIVGGYSGSPVISITPGMQESLVGVVSASAQSDRPDDYAVAGGYAIAEPVSRITELLDDPKMQSMQPVDTWCFPSKADADRLGPSIPVCQ